MTHTQCRIKSKETLPGLLTTIVIVHGMANTTARNQSSCVSQRATTSSTSQMNMSVLIPNRIDAQGIRSPLRLDSETMNTNPPHDSCDPLAVKRGAQKKTHRICKSPTRYAQNKASPSTTKNRPMAQKDQLQMSQAISVSHTTSFETHSPRSARVVTLKPRFSLFKPPTEYIQECLSCANSSTTVSPTSFSHRVLTAPRRSLHSIERFSHRTAGCIL